MRSLAFLRAIKQSTDTNYKCLSRWYHGGNIRAATSAEQIVDLRSDVLTKPTKDMLAAMTEASAGDDVFNEDENVHELQDKMAEMFGKQAALFVPSGTMGNLISVMSHTWHARGLEVLLSDTSHLTMSEQGGLAQVVMSHTWHDRGLEVLLGDMCHLTMYEQGGLAQIAHVHPRTLSTKPDGTFDLDQLEQYIRPLNDPHQPWTGLIAVENTHNNCGGKVLPLSFLKQLREKGDKHNLKIHMDGARLMNAAVALDVQPREILQHVDSVTMCFSKGMGTPIGSIMAGDREFIARSVRIRKLLGGGWRQPGVLAAAALHALDGARQRLAQDHLHAKQVATAIMACQKDVAHIDVEGVHTNLLFVKMVKPGLTAKAFCDRLLKVTAEEEKAIGERIVVKSMPFYHTIARIVLYSSIDSNQVQLAIKKLEYVLKELSESC